MRLRLPLRFSVFTFGDLHAPDRLDGVVDLGLARVWGGPGTCRRCSSISAVALLAHDRLDDDVAGILHLLASVARCVDCVDRARCSARSGQGLPGEDDPVVAQHVVGVQLADEQRAAPRAGCGSSTLRSRPRRSTTTRTRPSTPSASRAALALRSSGRPSPTRRRRGPCRRRPGRTAPSAGRGGSSSWGCAARSCGASGRGRRHHRVQCGARIEPWRARPVPFWWYGFAPPPRTSARVLVLCVPARRAASWAVTTWCITGTLGWMPKTSSSSSTSPASAPAGGLHGDGRHGYFFPPALTALRTMTTPPRRARHRALDEQQVALGVGRDDLEVERGDLLVAHATGHPDALEHPTRGTSTRRSSRAPGGACGCRGCALAR